MALITVTSGAYVGVHALSNGLGGFNGLAPGLGVTQNGYTLAWTVHMEDWKRSTSFGRSLIESLYVGADWSLSATFREWSSVGVVNAMWPWGNEANVNLVGTRFGVGMGRCGRRAGEHAGALVLTATAGTPAAGMPATFTAARAILAGNREHSWRFDSTTREPALRLNLLPYDLNGQYVPKDHFPPVGGPSSQIWFLTT